MKANGHSRVGHVVINGIIFTCCLKLRSSLTVSICDWGCSIYFKMSSVFCLFNPLSFVSQIIHCMGLWMLMITWPLCTHSRETENVTGLQLWLLVNRLARTGGSKRLPIYPITYGQFPCVIRYIDLLHTMESVMQAVEGRRGLKTQHNMHFGHVELPW